MKHGKRGKRYKSGNQAHKSETSWYTMIFFIKNKRHTTVCERQQRTNNDWVIWPKLYHCLWGHGCNLDSQYNIEECLVIYLLLKCDGT